MEMQENLDNSSLMKSSEQWKDVMKYYWHKRYLSMVKGQTMVAYRNYVTQFGKYLKCISCKKPFSENSVTVCWRCQKYTCWNCCDTPPPKGGGFFFPRMKEFFFRLTFNIDFEHY
jgi:hypothetical protein